MKIHYRLDVDSANYDAEQSGIENVIYKVNYTLWVWTGNKDLNKELEKGFNGEINVTPKNILRTSFGVDLELPEFSSETFIPIEDISKETLIEWMLQKWNHGRIEDLHAFKALVNSIKTTFTQNMTGFTPTQGSIEV